MSKKVSSRVSNEVVHWRLNFNIVNSVLGLMVKTNDEYKIMGSLTLDIITKKVSSQVSNEVVHSRLNFITSISLIVC